MAKRDLKNKPLIEALLEVKWGQPPVRPSGQELLMTPLSSSLGDPHYRVLLGRFSERVQADYPHYEQLATAQLPDSFVTQQVQHRFRVSPDGWPLLQLGPGIMTVNETKSYSWQDFGARCEKAFVLLSELHPAKGEFKPNSFLLRYINGVEADFSKESVFTFLRDKLKTSISVPVPTKEPANPVAFNWQATFPVTAPNGLMTLRFALGRLSENAAATALIWETLLHSTTVTDFSNWLTEAHDVIEDLFFRLIEGELEERFARG
jgi:uncharacterized protein (TIGR04255 family)